MIKEGITTPGGRHIAVPVNGRLVRKPVANPTFGSRESTPSSPSFYWKPVLTTVGKVFDLGKARNLGLGDRLDALEINEGTPCLQFRSGTVHVFDRRGNQRNIIKYAKKEISHG